MTHKTRRIINSVLIVLGKVIKSLVIMAIAILVGVSVSDVTWIQIGAGTTMLLICCCIEELIMIKIYRHFVEKLYTWVWENEDMWD